MQAPRLRFRARAANVLDYEALAALSAPQLHLHHVAPSIGLWLEEYRKRKGISQAELARRVGMLPQVLNRILKGRVEDPGFATVARIATELEIPLDQLVASLNAERAAATPTPFDDVMTGTAGADLIRDNRAAATLPFEIVDFHRGMTEVPLEAEVAAGEPMDYSVRGETVLVPIDFAPDGAKGEFLVRARGESMIEWGIDDGDYVIVEARPNGIAASGEIVIAWYNNGMTVKRWIRKAGRKILQGSTPETTYEIGPDDTFEIKGIVRRSFKIRQHPRISG